jgi:hypothetical protein
VICGVGFFVSAAGACGDDCCDVTGTFSFEGIGVAGASAFVVAFVAGEDDDAVEAAAALLLP